MLSFSRFASKALRSVTWSSVSSVKKFGSSQVSNLVSSGSGTHCVCACVTQCRHQYLFIIFVIDSVAIICGN